MRVLFRIVLVVVGSVVGGLLRWAVGLAAARLLGADFPWGTLLINVAGCLFLGWLLTVLLDHPPRGRLGADELRLLFGVGFAGAFTTFSTFGHEADALFEGGRLWAGGAYLLGSVVLGLLAVRLGVTIARRWRFFRQR